MMVTYTSTIQYPNVVPTNTKYHEIVLANACFLCLLYPKRCTATTLLCIWICVVDLKGGKVPPFYCIFETSIFDASFQLTGKQANKQREIYRNMQHSKIPDIQVGDDHSEGTLTKFVLKNAVGWKQLGSSILP